MVLRPPDRSNRCCNCVILTKWEKMMLVFGTIGILVTFVMAIVSLVLMSNTDDIIFGIIAIICSISTLFYLYRGIFGERSYELMIYVISAIIILIYVIINFIYSYSDSTEVVKIIKIIRLVVVILIVPFTGVTGTYIAYDYNVRGEIIFRTIGAFEHLQKSCKRIFMFEALLWLDLQFQLSIVALVIGLYLGYLKVFQIVILAVGVPFAALWTLFGFVCMRNEWRIGSYIFLLFGLLEPAYICFILYETIIILINSKQENGVNQINRIATMTIVCCFIALIIRVLIYVMNEVVRRNFNKGLKDKMAVKFGTCTRTNNNVQDSE